jgi:hypothetical protein
MDVPEFAYVITFEKLGIYIHLDLYIQYVHIFSCSSIKMLYSILKTTVPTDIKRILLDGISALK